jgi:tRNA A-37 threonylcarbamoyl transferase component Bud32
VGARLARLLVVVLVALACCGCTRQDDEVIELTGWTLVTTSGARRPVTLPARFSPEDMDARFHVTLETEVALPTAWRGQPVSVVLRWFPGPVKLEAEGGQVPCDQLGPSHLWRIDAAAVQGEATRLRMDADVRMVRMITSAPLISASEEGDSTSRLVRRFNFISAFASTTLLALLGGMLLVIFLLDRRHAEYGWLAFGCAMAAILASSLMEVPGPLLARANAIYGACAANACVSGMFFVRGYFRRPPPSTAWVGWMVVVTALAVAPIGTQALWLVGVVVPMSNVALTAYVASFPFAELRNARMRTSAMILASGYIAAAASILPDATFFASAHEGAGGAHFMDLGLVALDLASVVVVARDYVRSLHEVEARVKELGTRGQELEERNREVSALNEELRRQVAERSRELTEALARSEGSVAPAALEVGDVFDGRYRVTRALGRGGMGAVYEVARTRDGKKLALKVVTAALSGKQAARFAREAEIGARLQQENLVSIVDVGIAAGATPFLVMELVQGGSLEEQRARFGDAMWARPILRQIAAGLAELHAHHVVHRDLKPGNVLLVENGGGSIPIAKISDFGISRFGALDDSADVDVEGATVSPGAHSPSPRDLTETGMLLGTPVYMPPEAWFGPARHPSADVFSLGVLAYEALTGRSPFAVPPVLLVRARQPIPTPAPLDGVDARVASVLLACLRVEPSERPRAKELVDVLSDGAGRRI